MRKNCRGGGLVLGGALRVIRGAKRIRLDALDGSNNKIDLTQVHLESGQKNYSQKNMEKGSKLSSMLKVFLCLIWFGPSTAGGVCQERSSSHQQLGRRVWLLRKKAVLQTGHILFLYRYSFLV